MPEHYLEVKLPASTVVNADVVFEVFGDDEKLGELRISKGGVDWYARSARQAHSFTWERFSRLLEEA